MARLTQRECNPFKYSDSNKRYQTFDYCMKHRFGEKCAKISLDAGFTCPNIDGSKGIGGCIYCSGGSSGAACSGSLTEQYTAGVEAVRKKWSCNAFIPYLQAHTNTYADLATLEKIYGEASLLKGAVMLAVATRADCLDDGVCELLKRVSEKIPLLVELGLQSSNDETARRINRGHTFEEFIDGYEKLKSPDSDISVCVHIINGLPGEDRNDMMKTAADVAVLRPHMVKIHLLHVIRGTALCDMYDRGEYIPMERDDYIDITASQIELFAPETVIARVTGDGVADKLAAPMWSRRKTSVANDIDKLLYMRNSWQGKFYDKLPLY